MKRVTTVGSAIEYDISGWARCLSTSASVSVDSIDSRLSAVCAGPCVFIANSSRRDAVRRGDFRVLGDLVKYVGDRGEIFFSIGAVEGVGIGVIEDGWMCVWVLFRPVDNVLEVLLLLFGIFGPRGNCLLIGFHLTRLIAALRRRAPRRPEPSPRRHDENERECHPVHQGCRLATAWACGSLRSSCPL